ncbi:MAG: polysulfide reductase NrfD [Acidobacteria bacterium]|nr:polysulfide reductase NrfD [Acidobacteriota bacterium]MBI3658609.1 polysulfide reductase NrfD [Acidobacteriota bacterium]
MERPLDYDRNHAIHRDLLRPLFESGPKFYGLLAALASLMLWAIACWAYQIYNGLQVTGYNRPVMWASYETNFVFWVGISHAGTLISAILRVTGTEWRRPITRCAEAITTFALMIGPMFILIHLGRVWHFYWVIPYPSERGLWPNFRSPLLWDFSCINTYLLGSLTYLYLPMIPDLALIRDIAPRRQWLYRMLSLGWRGTERQWRLLERAISVMALIIMPLAVSVHTVVSWVFAMTIQPMWHSTIFGPYFVVGAIYSGIAAVLLAMWCFRRAYRLEAYFKPIHFNNLGLLLLTFSFLWFYFTFAEYMTSWYGNAPEELTVFWYKLVGPLAPQFWGMIICCFIIPVPILAVRGFRTPFGVMLASVFVLFGMWLERYTIIIGTMANPRLPFNRGFYSPSLTEISIMIGAFAYFAFLFIVFSKIFPIVSIWEIKEGYRLEEGAKDFSPGTVSEVES